MLSWLGVKFYWTFLERTSQRGSLLKIEKVMIEVTQLLQEQPFQAA